MVRQLGYPAFELRDRSIELFSGDKEKRIGMEPDQFVRQKPQIGLPSLR